MFGSGCVLSIRRVHSNEVKPMHSTSQSHALFGVTLPCPGKCGACKTELSIIQHEQEDVWSDMGGGQGPTKPGADRGYHFDVSVWACRVTQGALGNLLKAPPTHIQPLHFFFSLPSNADYLINYFHFSQLILRLLCTITASNSIKRPIISMNPTYCP